MVEGEAGLRGAPAGDLYIFLSVAPHRLFQRDGANIYCRVPLPMITAALGGSIEVPTIGAGRAKITVPAGTQTNQQFRLKGKGMPVLRSKAPGDMYVEVAIEPPEIGRAAGRGTGCKDVENSGVARSLKK